LLDEQVYLVVKLHLAAFFLLLQVCLVPFVALGQNRLPSVLTLEAANRIAKERSLRLVGADISTQSAEIAGREIRTGRLPQFRYRAGISYAPSFSSFGYDPALTNEGQVNAQVTLDESIYDGGARDIRSRQASIDQARSGKAKLLIAADLELAVASAFFDILSKQREIQLDLTSVNELTDYRDLITRLHAGGGAGFGDLLKTQLQLKQEELGLHRARAELTSRKYALAELLGDPGDTAFTLEGSIERDANPTVTDKREIDTALSLEHTLAVLDLDRAIAEADLSRAEKHPTLSLQGDVGVLTSVQNLRLASGNRASILGASVGITLDGPLLDWGGNDLRTEGKELEAARLRLELQFADRARAADFIRLEHEIVQAKIQLDSVHTLLRDASDAYALMRSKYAGGGALALEVLDAHRQVTDIRRVELDILTGLAASRAALERLLVK
jgi:outer membrane protein TolC